MPCLDPILPGHGRFQMVECMDLEYGIVRDINRVIRLLSSLVEESCITGSLQDQQDLD